MVGLKIHMKDLVTNMDKEISAVKNERGVDDYKNAKHFDKEFG